MKILGIDIYENNKDVLLENFKKIKSGYICVTSVHGLIESYENKKISLAFKNSFANVPDGMPIVYFGKIKRYLLRVIQASKDLGLHLYLIKQELKFKVFQAQSMIII